MKSKYIILCMVIGISLTSCTDKEVLTSNEGTPLNISAGVINDVKTRVTTDGNTTNWEIGDCIGVSGYGHYNIRYQAITATASSNFVVYTSGNDINIFASSDDKAFSAYYPWDGTEGTENNTPKTIDVNNTIDYMFAQKSIKDENLSLIFDHQLAKLTVTITDGTNEISSAQWKIEDGLHGGKIIQSTGVVTTDATTSSMAGAKSTGTFLILPAQTVNTGMLSVTANGKTYAIDLSKQNFTLSTGKNTLVKLAVNGKSISFTDNSTSSTSKWNNTNSDVSQYSGCTYSGHQWVQLKVGGTKWATMNIGASSTTDFGNYYSWGATYPTTLEPDDLTNDPIHYKGKYSSYYTWSKNNPSGYYQGTTSLPSTNDVATVLWGEDWRMPTEAEFNELTDTLKYSYSISIDLSNPGSGPKEYTIKCITPGETTGKVLILPAANAYKIVASGGKLSFSAPDNFNFPYNAFYWTSGFSSICTNDHYYRVNMDEGKYVADHLAKYFNLSVSIGSNGLYEQPSIQEELCMLGMPIRPVMK